MAEHARSSPSSTGVEVRVDSENFEDIRPKAAVAANVGSGPDIILGWYDDAHLYPDKLVPLTDVAEYLGKKYGGWYDVCRDYGMRGKEWIALPIGADGGAMVYRKSHMQGGRLRHVPDDDRRLPEARAGDEGEGHAGRPRARPRERRRDHLVLLDRLGPRRQDGRRKGQRGDQQPRDDRRARVRERAVRDLPARHAVVARSEQQQGVPRRADQPHEQCDLDLLRREELARREAEGDGGGHRARQLADRARSARRPSCTRSRRAWCSSTPSIRTRRRNICAS